MKQFSSVKEAMKWAFSSRSQSTDSALPRDEQSAKDITISIPTFSGTAEAEEVDISQYTEDDLKRLQLDDPFLYHSILKCKRSGSDSSSMNSSSRSTTTSCSSRRSSCPTIVAGQQQPHRRVSVTRSRRLSVEQHPSVVLKRIMNEMNIDDDDDDSVDEENEELIQSLSNGTFDL